MLIIEFENNQAIPKMGNCKMIINKRYLSFALRKQTCPPIEPTVAPNPPTINDIKPNSK